jgi:dienelactone hydrolase
MTIKKNMKTETIDYRVKDQIFRGYFVHDSKPGRRPAVLVVHEAWGLGEHVKRRAHQLAELGYAAFAVDMFGEGKTATEMAQGLEWTRALRADVDTLRVRIRAAFDTVTARPEVNAQQVACIGYCFGGTTSLELARSGGPVSGVVSFHGGLETTKPAEPGVVKAKLLVCAGADDPFVPHAHIEEFMQEMTKAGADYQVNIYGGAKHGFTNVDADARGLSGLAYNRQADQRSWQAMRDFFEEIFV